MSFADEQELWVLRSQVYDKYKKEHDDAQDQASATQARTTTHTTPHGNTHSRLHVIM